MNKIIRTHIFSNAIRFSEDVVLVMSDEYDIIYDEMQDSCVTMREGFPEGPSDPAHEAHFKRADWELALRIMQKQRRHGSLLQVGINVRGRI